MSSRPECKAFRCIPTVPARYALTVACAARQASRLQVARCQLTRAAFSLSRSGFSRRKEIWLRRTFRMATVTKLCIEGLLALWSTGMLASLGHQHEFFGHPAQSCECCEYQDVSAPWLVPASGHIQQLETASPWLRRPAHTSFCNEWKRTLAIAQLDHGL